MGHDPAPSQGLFDNLWDYSRVAQFFGVTERTIRRWARKGELRAVVTGERLVRFDPVDVLDAVKRMKRRRHVPG